MVEAQGEDGHAAIIKFDAFSSTCAAGSPRPGLRCVNLDEMGPIDAAWHVLNLFGAAVGVGAMSAALAKLLWRRELGSVSLLRLFAWASAAGAVVSMAGVVVLGRDGRMATYGAMVVACAVALWWAGFGPGRR